MGIGSSGAGKGDSPRYRHDANWKRNFEAIRFPKNDDGFIRISPGRQRKFYGVPSGATKPLD